MTATFRALLHRLRAAAGGAAAVEFALIVPVLSAFVVGIVQYGGMIMAYDNMHDAVSSGAVYVMRGGTTSTSIHDVAVSAWHSEPSDGAIVVTQVCSCAGVASTCSSLCADSSYPQSYTTIAGSGTYTGLWGNQAMASSQVVRTQ